MGSDCYTVSVETYREWTTREAALRLPAYGCSPATGKDFFVGDGPWIEIRLQVRCVHPDAPIGWDPLIVIRWLDEAVYRAARSDRSGFDFEKTPLFERYPKLWKMEMTLDDQQDSVVKIVEVEFNRNPTPREGRTDDPVGDTATITTFVHQKYAPNIADFAYWESRAWGGGAYFARDYLISKHPILAEIRPISPAPLAAFAGDDQVKALACRPEGGVWAATSGKLYAVTEGGGRAEVVLDLVRQLKLNGIRQLAAQADGTLWLCTMNAVVRRTRAGDTTVFRRGEAFDCKKIQCVAVSPDGVAFAGAENGLHCLGAGDAWTHVRDGLAERSVERIAALGGGVAWAGGRHLTRRNADGSLERFQSRQGIDATIGILPLPDGGIWALRWGVGAAYVAPGAGRAVPDAFCGRVAPGGLRQGALGPDGTLWAIARGGFLVRLRAGDAPRAYVWSTDEGAFWDDVAELCASPEGDVWLRLGDGRLARMAASDLAAVDKTTPINADMPHFKRIAPASFGPARPAAAAAPTIDFKGKTVVITGTLSKLTRDQAQRALADRGALLADSVNKKTSYLIVGLKPSSKLQKAQSLGIPILDEDVLLSPA